MRCVVLLIIWQGACDDIIDYSPLCPCASSSDYTNVSGIPPGYGIGCGTHDISWNDTWCTSLWCNSCKKSIKEPWCSYRWCYVASGCKLPRQPSELFKDRRYSYETCGSLNPYQTVALRDEMSGTDVALATLTNSGGWKGSFCTDNRGSLFCQGPTYMLIQALVDSVFRGKRNVLTLTSSKFTEDQRFPPQVMAQVERAHPGSTSAFTACVYATAMGYVDICIGGFTMTPSRLEISNFVTLIMEPVILVGPKEPQEKSVMDYIGSCFTPFRTRLWLTLVAAHVLFALAMTFNERIPGGAMESLNLRTALRKGIYTSFAAIFKITAPPIASTLASRITNLALGALILLSTVSYTASLAASRVLDRSLSGLTSIDDVKAQNLMLCTQSNLVPTLLTISKLEETDLVVKESRSEVWAGIDAGECTVAVQKKEDFELVQADGKMCQLEQIGDTLFTIQVGIPVSEKVSKFIGHRIAELWLVWQKNLQDAMPQEKCGATLREVHTAIDIEDLLGIFIIAFVALLLGAFIRIMYFLKLLDPGTVPQQHSKSLLEHLQEKITTLLEHHHSAIRMHFAPENKMPQPDSGGTYAKELGEIHAKLDALKDKFDSIKLQQGASTVIAEGFVPTEHSI